MSQKHPWGAMGTVLLPVALLLLAAATSSARYSGGTGEPTSPYTIATANDLNDIHNYPEDCNKHFVLAADIDMNGFNFSTAVVAPDTNPAQNGFQGPAFTGLFDGQNHMIGNITINGGSNKYLGLFGTIGSGGQVANVRIEDVVIRGDNCVGALAGLHYGRIDGCRATGELQGDDSVGGLAGYDRGTIENSTVAATVQGDWDVGGLVGQCDGIIHDCNAAGGVNGNSLTGGLVGHLNSATVYNCQADANVTGGTYVGGLVGHSEWSDVSDCNSTGDASGTDHVGGLIGWQHLGDVFRCHSAVEVTGNNYLGGLIGKHESGRLISCHASGHVEGNDYLGGFVGYVYGYCTDCSASGTIVGNDWLGGFAGYADGYFFMCSAIGDVNGHNNLGGFAGYCEADSVDNCYAAVNVSGGHGSQNHGGLVGHNAGCDISNCYTAGVVWGPTCCGRVVGLNSGTVIKCLWDHEIEGVPQAIGCDDGGTVVDVLSTTTAEMQEMQMYTDLGWDFAGELDNGADDFWRIPDGGGYPEFGPGRTAWYDWSTNVGDGTDANPYQIATAVQLLSIGWRSELLNKCFVLTSNIDLSGYVCHIAPIAPFGLFFEGVFDGRGREISNMNVLGEPHQLFVGMVGTTGHRSEVRNINLSDASVTGDAWVGGLIGYCGGDVTDCRVFATVHGIGAVGGALGQLISGQAVNLGSSGSVSGDDGVGGLVGYQFGTGSIQRCFSRSDVTGRSQIGGLVGLCFDGSIEDSYARANVTGSDDSSAVGGLIGSYENPYLNHITNCYAAGAVDGNDDVGGLVGNSGLHPHFADCFWDGDVNPDLSGIGNLDDPNVIGRKTAEMQTRTNYTEAGWDFVTTWDICDGTNYPRLTWELPVAGDFICPDGVNFIDYAYLGDVWNTSDPNADLDLSGLVDPNDLKLFCYHWLEGL